MGSQDGVERAGQLYEKAVFGGDVDALRAADRELDAVEADLALARGRVVHGRFLAEGVEDERELELFERALELYQSLDDRRGEAEALFWIGLYHQLIGRDNETAVGFLRRSLTLAEQVQDPSTMGYALRHLGIAEHQAGRLDAAREHLQASTRLRQEQGFTAGVAANLVGLAYIAAAQGDPNDAKDLLRQAGSLAEASQAFGILRQAQEAQNHLDRRP